MRGSVTRRAGRLRVPVVGEGDASCEVMWLVSPRISLLSRSGALLRVAAGRRRGTALDKCARSGTLVTVLRNALCQAPYSRLNTARFMEFLVFHATEEIPRP